MLLVMLISTSSGWRPGIGATIISPSGSSKVFTGTH